MAQGGEIAIGIDLGTTNSAVAVFEDGGPRVLMNRLGEPLTPSVVALDPEGGGLLVGRAAREVLALQPERAAAAFKRGMGKDTGWALGGETYGPVELSALVLRTLREDAEAALGVPVSQAVITVPAYFDDAQRAATMKAGELAGLEVLRIVNEPTAAAMAYGLHRRQEDCTFLVFDLGGGTFDVCVMELFDGTLQVLSTAGESQLGGEDFTRRLAGHALEEIGLGLEAVELADRGATALLLKRAELAKRRLAQDEEVTLVIPPVHGSTQRELLVRIGRAEAERAWSALIRRLEAPCRAALRGARLRTSQLDEVILVGGATRMPFIAGLVRDIFEREPAHPIDTDLAVVQGAAIQAALTLQDAAVEDLVVTDVAAHSLGVEVVKTFGSRHVEGYFSPIIHRNTVIPASRTESYYTVDANQSHILLRVYEGESRRVNENTQIGELDVTGIARGPAGQEVQVTFTYDLNGLLEVEARVVATGKKLARIFQRGSAALSEAGLEKAKIRLRKLKDDPRKKPAYRDLLLRAESLWRELPPERRGMLEFAMDAFEDALAQRDTARIDETFRTLVEWCQEEDGDDRW